MAYTRLKVIPYFRAATWPLLATTVLEQGSLATHILPLSILFAGRNNLLRGITTWEYSTFGIFHLRINRIIVILALINSVEYGVLLHQRGTSACPYILLGVAAIWTGIMIVIVGLSILRRRSYDIVLLLHIAFAVVFVVGVWIHRNDLKFLWFFHVSVWIWLSDRLLRLHKLISFGFPSAEVRLNRDFTLKVIVTLPVGFKAVPDGHCFIHLLLPFCFWQHHPFSFSIAGSIIMFYIHVKDGVTYQLQKVIERSESDTIRVSVAVEGSYSESTPAAKYTLRVFVAGGNDFHGIYAEALDIARQYLESGKNQMIWDIRDLSSLDWLLEEISQLQKSLMK